MSVAIENLSTIRSHLPSEAELSVEYQINLGVFYPKIMGKPLNKEQQQVRKALEKYSIRFVIQGDAVEMSLWKGEKVIGYYHIDYPTREKAYGCKRNEEYCQEQLDKEVCLRVSELLEKAYEDVLSNIISSSIPEARRILKKGVLSPENAEKLASKIRSVESHYRSITSPKDQWKVWEIIEKELHKAHIIGHWR